MATPALVKRYSKLLSRLQQWTPSSPSDPLTAAHAELLSDASSLPTTDAVADADVGRVEEWLKRVEQFSRQVQVAQGLGREDGPDSRKQAGGGGGGRDKAATAEEKKAKPAKPAAQQPQLKKEKEKAQPRKEKAEESKEGDRALLPDYIQHRIAVWDRVAAAAAAAASQSASASPITVTLPDGKTLSGTAGVTTPFDIARQLTNNSDRFVVARVDNDMWDMHRPLPGSCSLTLLDFESKEGQHAFWHSSAHILGQAVELEYGDVRLCVGPPLDDGGFYYDVEMGEQKVSPADFPKLEKAAERITREQQPFTRLVLSKEQALDMFRFNPFKQEIIRSKVPDGANCTAYRCGNLVDLCKGPHLPNTGVVKALAVTKASSAYWLAKADNASLQRVYGISFPSKQRLKEWEEFQRRAEERDHRRVGLQQKLFFFHEWSPGSCFFLPHGARVYNRLCNFIRDEYSRRGYSEVISPNVFNVELWKKSGHYDNYKENMFLFQAEGVDFGMKPMNCPGHCLMFASTLHSYRELPIRLADFGVLHRNEISGALTGLTRVRRFQQDDAHIFARQDQIQQEVRGVLEMLESVYGVFGFKYSLALSTRPEKYLGEKEVWDRAEKALEQSLTEFLADKNRQDELRWQQQQAASVPPSAAQDTEEKKSPADSAAPPAQPAAFTPMQWTYNHGDGAFYGPKIDIQLTDALHRRHQCATIQLDFQLPIRFELSYKDEDSSAQRPVIIHRAILGSVERMMAVLIEHTGGKWPFWLSPRQVCVVPVTETLQAYAKQVGQLLHADGLYVDVDDSSATLNKKIREAQLEQYNLIAVVGGKEEETRTVTVRLRDDPNKQMQLGLDEFRDYCKALVREYK